MTTIHFASSTTHAKNVTTTTATTIAYYYYHYHYHYYYYYYYNYYVAYQKTNEVDFNTYFFVAVCIVVFHLRWLPGPNTVDEGS